MTAKELMDILATVRPDTLIILSKDGEGNGYSPLADMSRQEGTVYVAESTWSGEIHVPPGEDADPEDIETYEDAVAQGVHAICLWPVN